MKAVFLDETAPCVKQISLLAMSMCDKMPSYLMSPWLIKLILVPACGMDAILAEPVGAGRTQATFVDGLLPCQSLHGTLQAGTLKMGMCMGQHDNIISHASSKPMSWRGPLRVKLGATVPQ